MCKLSASRVASGSGDRTIRLWDTASGAVERVMHGHTATVSALVLATPELLVSGGGDYTVRIWRAHKPPIIVSLADWTPPALRRPRRGRAYDAALTGAVSTSLPSPQAARHRRLPQVHEGPLRPGAPPRPSASGPRIHCRAPPRRQHSIPPLRAGV